MRHKKRKFNKLGRDAAHRKSMLGNQVVSLISHKRITTTLAKAKATQRLAEKMVTLGKRGDLHARRLAVARLRSKDAVSELFAVVAPAFQDRQGGYTRIVKLGKRADSSEMAILEWVDYTPSVEAQEASA